MDPLTQLQADAAAMLRAEAFFEAVPVLEMAKGVKSSDIEARLGKRGYTANDSGKSGCCVVVMMPATDVPNPEPSGPRCEVTMPFAVYERPVINRGDGGTGETAEEIAMQILAALHGRRIRDGVTQLRAEKRAIEPLALDDESTVAYMVYVAATLQLAPRPQVSTPVFTGNASALSIACNTPGAALYYTLDGSFPSPTVEHFYGYVIETESGLIVTTEEGNPLAGDPEPIVVPSGTRVRAAAYLTGTHRGSDVAEFLNP